MGKIYFIALYYNMPTENDLTSLEYKINVFLQAASKALDDELALDDVKKEDPSKTGSGNISLSGRLVRGMLRTANNVADTHANNVANSECVESKQCLYSKFFCFTNCKENKNTANSGPPKAL
jgi:hypothetical protein